MRRVYIVDFGKWKKDEVGPGGYCAIPVMLILVVGFQVPNGPAQWVHKSQQIVWGRAPPFAHK